MTDFLELAVYLFEVIVMGFLPLSIALVAFVYARAILKALRKSMKKSMDEGITELVK